MHQSVHSADMAVASAIERTLHVPSAALPTVSNAFLLYIGRAELTDIDRHNLCTGQFCKQLRITVSA